MRHVFNQFALVFALCLLSSCGTSKQESSRAEEIKAAKERMAVDLPTPFPPGTCKVIATIESIDTTVKGKRPDDPCSKGPCSATVRIDSVLGYGSAFPKAFVAGQSVQVKFAQTLSPTKELFPDIQPALPGLHVKDRFQAFVSGSGTLGTSEPTYEIYGYEKK